MEKYSVGHELILQSERNALVTLSDLEFSALSVNDKIFSIIRASLICSRPYSECFRKNRLLHLWHWIISREDFLKAIKDFSEYRANGSTYPNAPTREADQIANGKEDEGRSLGGDLMPRLINFLVGKEKSLGYESVYDVPLGLALHLYFTDLELEGRIKIENERERQVREELAEHLAMIAKERKEALCQVLSQ